MAASRASLAPALAALLTPERAWPLAVLWRPGAAPSAASNRAAVYRPAGPGVFRLRLHGGAALADGARGRSAEHAAVARPHGGARGPVCKPCPADRRPDPELAGVERRLCQLGPPHSFRLPAAARGAASLRAAPAPSRSFRPVATASASLTASTTRDGSPTTIPTSSGGSCATRRCPRSADVLEERMNFMGLSPTTAIAMPRSCGGPCWMRQCRKRSARIFKSAYSN